MKLVFIFNILPLITIPVISLGPREYIGGDFFVEFPAGANQRVCINISTVLYTDAEIDNKTFTATVVIPPRYGAQASDPNVTIVFISGQYITND